LGKLARFTRAVMFGPDEAYARDVLAEGERFAPDALAIDCMLFGALVAAERAGVPTAALVHTIYPFPVDGTPPFGYGLRPARGGVFAPSELRLPANVVAVGSAPHRAVLPSARLVVAHGGHGTTMKALACGVPLLTVPLGRDQADIAARVVEAGAGLRLSPSAR